MKKFITTVFVLAMFAFVSPTVQAQSGDLSYNENKIEGLAMAAFRQSPCNVKGKVNVEIEPYHWKHYVRIVVRDKNNRTAGVTGLMRIRNLDNINTPSDISFKCKIRKPGK